MRGCFTAKDSQFGELKNHPDCVKTRGPMAQNRNTEELFGFWARLTVWAVRTSKKRRYAGLCSLFRPELAGKGPYQALIA